MVYTVLVSYDSEKPPDVKQLHQGAKLLSGPVSELTEKRIEIVEDDDYVQNFWHNWEA